jgi:hypothetical protein
MKQNALMQAQTARISRMPVILTSKNIPLIPRMLAVRRIVG